VRSTVRGIERTVQPPYFFAESTYDYDSPPAVAGVFYPAKADEFRAAITVYLRGAHATGPIPKAIIAPHAGYIYSGPVAASAYAHLTLARGSVRRLALLGPAHRVTHTGLAAQGILPGHVTRSSGTALTSLPLSESQRVIVWSDPRT